jgi:hypothetical protein
MGTTLDVYEASSEWILISSQQTFDNQMVVSVTGKLGSLDVEA